MSIETDRLKTNRAYWDQCAPDQTATHCWLGDKRIGPKWYRVYSDTVASVWLEDGKWVPAGGWQDLIRGAIPRPPAQPAWDGEGLPQSGTVCNILGTSSGSWYKGMIDYIDEKHCIWHWMDGSRETMHNRVSHMKFRPLHTPEDRAVEAMRAVIDDCEAQSVNGRLRALYRAGYRKQEPNQ